MQGDPTVQQRQATQNTGSLWGGGSIPLEALRLGCETYSSDINPVAIIIQKCIAEYPQKFSNPTDEKSLTTHDVPNKLAVDVKKWSDWVSAESYKEIGKFYPEKNDHTIIGYIFARTVFCQNSNCGIEIPLLNYYWLANKSKPDKKIALFPIVNGKKIQFKIVGNGYSEMPNNFDPNKGTTSKGRAICISCGTVIEPELLKKLFWTKKAYDKQLAIILTKNGISGKIYQPVSDLDHTVFSEAKKFLKLKRKELFQQLNLDPVPDEIIPTPNNTEYQPGGLYYVHSGANLYGMTKWNHLFNPRQCLSLIVFTEKIKSAYQKMLDNGYDLEYAKAATTYLALMLDKLAEKNSNFTRYHVKGEKIENTFGRQALTMTWYYPEINPFVVYGWPNIQNWILKVIEHCSNIRQKPANIIQESATNLSSYPNEYFDAVFTDPPYYDNIPYSMVSDFFYVWLKRSIGHLYPELFSTPLTPKSDEVIASLPLSVGMNKKDIKNKIDSIKSKEDFEILLSKSFKEMYRVLKNDGIAVIVYAHKSTDGWTTLINSILESNLVITAAWPINTEMKARLVAMESAALNSSIYMVARKIKKEKVGFYRDIKKQLENHVTKKLKYLWGQGISGGDFFISAIGTSMEIFGKCQKIIDDEDNQISVTQLLDDVRKIVTDFAIKQVLDGGIHSEISQMTRFYILWRWAYGNAKVPFDDAKKMTQSLGINLEDFAKGFIKKENSFVKVLSPDERNIDEINSTELIDVLHKSAILWRNNKTDQMQDLLTKSGFGGTDVFYRVIQAIAESTPQSSESKLLHAFLSSKGTIMDSMRRDSAQTKLD